MLFFLFKPQEFASFSGNDFMPISNSIDCINLVNNVGIMDGGGVNEQLDALTAYKSETGAMYYYSIIMLLEQLLLH